MAEVMNLLEETLNDLKAQEKMPTDVKWVGARDGSFAITWGEFAKIANIAYHEGFGGQEIAKDLVVVGSDWWLERYEYDGSEGWIFQRKPTLQDAYKPY